MAFSYTLTERENIGGVRRVGGLYTNSGGSTGGTINTGLSVVNGIALTPSSADSPYYSTSLPSTATDGAITIVSASNAGGTWEAFGV